ncbi:MAG: hypothetical protein C3F13_05740 [Anaerolineales bacterium]|nr:MAG: hypothetical protein C3F13_05740 [Anaerolineales bacterium]
MKNQMTTRDIELLSAYLDNQLSSKDRAHLEARLTAEPELRKELQALDQTRQLLRQLPRHRAPRNYYLKPDMVTRPAQALKLAPIFGVVSAVASVLLALVMIGSRLATPTSQVALAPAQALPSEAITVQQEVARSAPAEESPTEAPPVVAMGAPILATSTPFAPPEGTELPGAPTPTTIYLFAFPPTSTPEAGMSIAGLPSEIPTLSCEEYYDTGPLPDLPALFYCPTPTTSFSELFESMPAQDALTPTLTTTPEHTATPYPTGTSTPTETPIPTDTPSPSATPTPFYTSTSLPALKSIPPAAADNTGVSSPAAPLLGVANPTTSAATEAPASSAGGSILSYVMLSAEISLAVIIVVAGILAIILRFRARDG